MIKKRIHYHQERVAQSPTGRPARPQSTPAGAPASAPEVQRPAKLEREDSQRGRGGRGGRVRRGRGRGRGGAGVSDGLHASTSSVPPPEIASAEDVEHVRSTLSKSVSCMDIARKPLVEDDPVEEKKKKKGLAKLDLLLSFPSEC